MDTDEHGLNTEVRDCVFSLSANGVGGEGRGEVARENQTPSSLGRGEGKLNIFAPHFYPCPSVSIHPPQYCYGGRVRG